jgi:hypothetical protein
MSEISSESFRVGARREAQQAVQRLAALNNGCGEAPPPLTPIAQLEPTFALLYARFVARWNTIKP